MREVRSNESRHVCYRINILGSQLSPSSDSPMQFGTLVSWEGNRVSGVAPAMRHRHRGLFTYTGSTAKDREMSTHAYGPSGRGTIYLTCHKRRLNQALSALSLCIGFLSVFSAVY